MQDLIRRLITEFKGGWRFRWLAVALAWCACIAGWLVVYYLPDSFESEATVYVDTSSALRPLLETMTIDTDVLEQVELVTTAMLGRPQLEKVARETDLYLRAKTPEDMDNLIFGLRDRIRISNDRRRDPNLYIIKYRDVDRQMAQAVVARLLNNFVEDSLGADRQDTRNAQEFLRQELASLEQDLSSSEQELADFKKRNVGQMPGSGGDYFVRLQDEMAALEKVRSSLRLAQRREQALQQQLSGEQPIMDSASGPRSELDTRIAQHQATLEDLQLRFTDLHPDVIAVKDTLEQLRRQKQLALEDLSGDSGVGQVSDNPVYQNIQIELTTVRVEIASLREEEAGLMRSTTELRELIDVLPQVEAELARLTRDYDVKQTQYQSLLQRLGVAELSDAAEQSEDVKFRVIDPPILPDGAAAPNRPLLLAFVLIAGLGVGGGCAFLANQLRPVFPDPRSVRDSTGLPVLGAITIMTTASRRKRRAAELAAFSVAVMSLCFLFVLVFVFREAGSQFVQSVV